MASKSTELNWAKVSAWRLSQHQLHERAGLKDLNPVVSRLGGVQAQVMSAAQLALWARLEGISPADVDNALWQDRSLVKTWVMRGTLHFVNTSDFPLFVAAHGAFEPRRPPSYYRYHNVTPEELEAILECIPAVLSAKPITREELAAQVAKRAGSPNLQQVLLSGWGALLKPSAFRGDLCFGPNQGQNITFVKPDAWIGKQLQQMDPQEAVQEVARRYLATYGPAGAEDFARWWGIEPGRGKKVFAALAGAQAGEIEEVVLEGRKVWALSETLEAIQASSPGQTVRLLPQFDAYTLGAPRDSEYILAKAHKARVYRPQGWVSAVVLVNGGMQGVWELNGQRAKTLQVKMFDKASPEVKKGILAEAERLGRFLGTTLETEFA